MFLDIKVIHSSPTTITLSGPCIMCKVPHRVEVKYAEFEAYIDGQLIQDAMPSVSDDDREFLISGTCPPCYAKLFGED